MLDRFFGRNESPPDDPDEYALIQLSPNRTKIKSYDDPVEPAFVQLNEDLPAGTYQLQVVNNGQFGELIWKKQIGDDPAEEAVERAQRAEQKAQRAERQAQERSQERTTPRFEDPFDHLAYEVVSAAVTNEDIMAQKGDEILGRALESAFTGGGPEVNYSLDSEFDMILYELRSDPQRASEYVTMASDLASTLGQSLGEGMRDGLAGDSDDESEEAHSSPEKSLESALDGIDSPTGSVVDDQPSTSDEIDSGPSTLEEVPTGQDESEADDTESNDQTMTEHKTTEKSSTDTSEEATQSETTSENPSPEDLAEAI